MSLEVSPTTGFQYLFKKVIDRANEKSKKLIIFALLTVVIIIYVFLFNSLGVTHNISQGAKSGGFGLKMIELLLWGIFLFLISVNALQYFFELDFKATIINLFSDDPQIKIGVSPNYNYTGGVGESEVFHIGDNVYTYDEAKILCEAHDGELASYEQIEKAYNNGAEWCSYGWSKDQMALFPTQKKTYNELKKYPESKNNCGRPGINGGFIDNPNARFGVNCFARKLKPTDSEKKEMNATNIVIPKTKKNDKLEFYKRNIHKIIKRPFNSDKWSAL